MSATKAESLDLHPKMGQQALKEAGLFQVFQKLSRPEGQADKIVRYDAEVLWHEDVLGCVRPVEEDDRPEIDRNDLRNLLLDSVEPGSIQWGRRVDGVERDSERVGKSNINFADGFRSTDVDLVVGADRTWSKVRPRLTEIQPHYSGIIVIELRASDVSTTNA